MILQIGYRISGQDANTLFFYKPALLTVLPDRLHIAACHCPVKQELFCRLPVFDLINIVIRFQKKPFIFIAHYLSPFLLQILSCL